jgi:hypothetical protein
MCNPLVAFHVCAGIATGRLVVDQKAVLREYARVVVEQTEAAALVDAAVRVRQQHGVALKDELPIVMGINRRVDRKIGS